MEEGQGLSSLERYQLIDDAFSMAEAGRGSYADAIRMSAYLEKEKAWLPWSAALSQLNRIGTAFEATSDYEVVREYMLPRISQLYSGLNWDSKVDEEDPLVFL